MYIKLKDPLNFVKIVYAIKFLLDRWKIIEYQKVNYLLAANLELSENFEFLAY